MGRLLGLLGQMEPDAVATTGFTVNENAEVYYGRDYWNDHAEVRAWMNQKISGDPDAYWGERVARATHRTFKRALILNCGNGHVERGLIAEGLTAEAVGIDYSEELIGQARHAASAAGVPARYIQLDINSAAIPDCEFDLVVNHAAAHHIAYIDRVFRELCRAMPDDGCFVSFDYVGPHRNQYRWSVWDACVHLNESLPERFRHEMSYPHLPTMLLHDPTEAIHSELIIETMGRYFHLDEVVPIGGAIAYPLLTHNQNMFAVAFDDPERIDVIGRILAEDDAYAAEHPEDNLFAFVLATPDKAALEDTSRLAQFTEEEEARESAAARDGGRYYSLTSLQRLTQDLERTRVDALHSQDRVEDLGSKNDQLSTAYSELQARNTELATQCGSLQDHYDELKATYDRIMSLPPYRQARWLARTRTGSRILKSDRGTKLLRRNRLTP